MGFNRRKLEDQRREAAEKEAATRRATDAQERPPGQANAHAVLADDRRCRDSRLLVSMGPLPGLPNNQCARWTVIPTRR
jgi:hypothetical protein